MGRRAYGIELSDQYFNDGLRYCKEAEQEVLTPTLFDWLEQVQSMEKAAQRGL